MLFGTSGIRGVFGKEITPALASSLGLLLPSLFGKRFVVATDTRESGKQLMVSLLSGLAHKGASTTNIGIAPTPTLSLAARELSSFGIMITASHNPPEYNGFKLFDSKGRELGEKEEKLIELKLKPAACPRPKPLPEGRGKFATANFIDRHIHLALSLVNTELIAKVSPKVVVDCGNGACSRITPYALRMAGCRVIGVNCEPSGIFSRGLEPTPENLSDTCKILRAVGAGIGIAHDGDGDRTVIIDEKGELLGLDAQLAIMCSEILGKNKGKIVTTVEASSIVKRTAEKFGGSALITKVGSRNVGRMVEARHALFGGEPCGEYIFPAGVPVADGVASALKFVEIFCKHGKLSALKSKFKIPPMRRAKFQCADKEKAMLAIKGELKKNFKGIINEEDGLRMDFKGGSLLVRASGTEPAIRITAEHKSKIKLDALFKKAEKIVGGSI